VIDDDDDEEEDGSQEAPSASRDYDEVEVSYVLYGKWENKVVGCRFYSGMATMGEIVMGRCMSCF